MSPVLVAASAYGASRVRQLGQSHFIDVVADAGGAGIEIRRELFTSDLPDLARDICRMAVEQVELLTARLTAITAKIAAASRAAAMPKQLQTMPGIGPIGALAIETFAPPMNQFRRGRDFAAWLGLVPRQHSSGGKQRLGKTSKMGQRDIRRLLVTGAMSVIRWALRKGALRNPWLERLLERKPPMVAAFALANKMARGIWAMLTRGEDYRDPMPVGA